MDAKIRINVLVPEEIRYIFDPDSDPMFIAAREHGQIVVRPINDYDHSSSRNVGGSDYRKGFMNGVLDGYEDGYNRGFTDSEKRLAYDPRYKGASWLSEACEYDFPTCAGNCRECKFYDDIFDICRYERTGCLESDI